MEQTELLWLFQQADMEADSLENEMKRSPTRIALKKNREFLVEQQAAVKRMEEEVAEMLDRVDIIKEAISRMEEQLGTLQKHMQEAPPETLEQAHVMNRDAQRFLNDLGDYEHEMQRIQKDATDRDRLEKEIRTKYARVKAEYDIQKVEYEAQYKEQMQVLEGKRRIAQEKSIGIDAALLEKYSVIKLHCVPPVAKLLGDQCGGCNMSLPQVTLRNIKSGVKIIECETCGRMLIQLKSQQV